MNDDIPSMTDIVESFLLAEKDLYTNVYVDLLIVDLSMIIVNRPSMYNSGLIYKNILSLEPLELANNVIEQIDITILDKLSKYILSTNNVNPYDALELIENKLNEFRYNIIIDYHTENIELITNYILLLQSNFNLLLSKYTNGFIRYCDIVDIVNSREQTFYMLHDLDSHFDNSNCYVYGYFKFYTRKDIHG